MVIYVRNEGAKLTGKNWAVSCLSASGVGQPESRHSDSDQFTGGQ